MADGAEMLFVRLNLQGVWLMLSMKGWGWVRGRVNLRFLGNTLTPKILHILLLMVPILAELF